MAAVADMPGDAWPASSSSRPSSALPRAGPAVGQAGPNAMYMGMRLQYQPTPEPGFDPLGSVRFIRQMIQRWVLYFVVYSFGAFAGIIICGLIALVISWQAGLILFVIAAVVIGLALAVCFWLLKIPVQLSEWKISVDNKAAAAPMVFDHIAWVLSGRAVPLDSLQVRRLSLPGDGVRDYLELRSGLFNGYVACFPYGQDLYVGWTFWITLSPFRYVCMIIARIWQSLFNRGNDLYTSFRYDSARAMRETMHSAAREGVDVAIGQLAGHGQGIVGSLIGVAESAG
jgi:MFS family permease